MVTMGIKDFLNYLDKLAKKFHKDYKCILFSGNKKENIYELNINLLKIPEEKITYKIGRNNTKVVVYSMVPKKFNPFNECREFKIIATENELVINFRTYMTSGNFLWSDIDLVNFDEKFIEREMKKFIFNMELGE